MRVFRFRAAGVCAIRRIVQMRVCVPVVVRVVARTIVPMNRHPNPELGVLLLDAERWWSEDVAALGARVQLFSLRSDWRQRILSLFLTEDDLHTLRTQRLTGAGGIRYDALIQYLMVLLSALAERLGFHVVTTVNYMYVANAPIAEACSRTSIPFVDCYKECMKDDETAALFIAKCRRQRLRTSFLGNRICVYNTTMRRTLLDLGVATPDRVVVTGSLRIDRFLERVRSGEAERTARDTVTLFSFRHLPNGADPKDYIQHFSPDGRRGYARLFTEVHASIGALAVEHPNIHFVVKLKWSNIWGNYVRRAVAMSGYDAQSLPNVRIIGLEEDAQDLILRSIAVIGVNSTTLLEARLAGRPVVIPYFGELRDRYPETLLFRGISSEFTYVESAEQLRSRIAALIAHPPAFRAPLPEMFDRYFGPNDGCALDRVLEAYHAAIREQAVPRMALRVGACAAVHAQRVPV